MRGAPEARRNGPSSGWASTWRPQARQPAGGEVDVRRRAAAAATTATGSTGARTMPSTISTSGPGAQAARRRQGPDRGRPLPAVPDRRLALLQLHQRQPDAAGQRQFRLQGQPDPQLGSSATPPPSTWSPAIPCASSSA